MGLHVNFKVIKLITFRRFKLMLGLLRKSRWRFMIFEELGVWFAFCYWCLLLYVHYFLCVVCLLYDGSYVWLDVYRHYSKPTAIWNWHPELVCFKIIALLILYIDEIWNYYFSKKLLHYTNCLLWPDRIYSMILTVSYNL